MHVFASDQVGRHQALTSAQAELWSLAVRDGRLALGQAPLETAPQGPYGLMDIRWLPATPRWPQLVAAYAVGFAPDGRRIVLGSAPRLLTTPQWWGSAVAFFLGG